MALIAWNRKYTSQVNYVYSEWVLLKEPKIISGTNPTITRYNASVVQTRYIITQIVAHCIFFIFKNAVAHYNDSVVVVNAAWFLVLKGGDGRSGNDVSQDGCAMYVRSTKIIL
jgi:hypothetical protein